MSAFHTFRRRVYEFGSATVFVHPCQVTFDGIIRVEFDCKVHPVGEHDVFTTSVSAFYPWAAANEALRIYRERNAERI